MSDDVVLAGRAQRLAVLQAALLAARSERRGVPDSLELQVRDFARASREAGTPIAQLLIELKELVRHQMGADEPLFTPKVVGWAVAGYFDGTGRERM
jgi:hypothetical protein